MKQNAVRIENIRFTQAKRDGYAWNVRNCIDYMKTMPDGCVNLTITDIPYGEVNRDSNGLRTLDKENADIMTFDLQEFLPELFRVTSGTIIIFCGKEQLSEIHKFFSEKQKKHQGTVRQLIWKKTNPSPMNGQHIYLSGIENGLAQALLGTHDRLCRLGTAIFGNHPFKKPLPYDRHYYRCHCDRHWCTALLQLPAPLSHRHRLLGGWVHLSVTVGQDSALLYLQTGRLHRRDHCLSTAAKS